MVGVSEGGQTKRGERGKIKGTRLQRAGKNGAGGTVVTKRVIRGLEKKKWVKSTKAGG